MEAKWNEKKFQVEQNLMNLVKNFSSDNVGLLFNKDKYNKEIDYFEMFFDDEIYNIIISESNRYFMEKYMSDAKFGTGTWQYQYKKKQITKQDIKSYFAILLCMAIVDLPQKRMYWSEDPLLRQNYIASIMPRLRFEMISAALHLKEDIKEIKNNLTKIIPFMNTVSIKFRIFYNIDQNITIDESMISFKGRSEYRFYMPMKPIRYGFKLHALTESQTGYCYNFLLDVGKKNLQKLIESSEWEDDIEDEERYILFIVNKLLSCLPFKGYNLYMDSWYNSVYLAEYLVKKGITVTGPLKKNSSDLPKTSMNEELRLGERQTRSSALLSLTRWKDKKEMILISSIFSGEKIESNLKNKKEIPEIVKKYSSNMRGVDRMDQSLEYLNLKRKSYKWWKPIFYHVLEISINNAFILFSKAGYGNDRYQFKRNLIEQLINNKTEKTVEKNNFKYDLNKLHKCGFVSSDQRKRCKFCQMKTIEICNECSEKLGKLIYLHAVCSVRFHIEENIYKKMK